ncbi:MAG: MBL fold metallo-hydrolase [Deltaproteobacteria bacterium]|nr:MBL fold metallo-hydrolase [Deltaproteobacteria bacterium]
MKIAEDLFFYPWESYSQNNSNTIMISGRVKTLIDPGHKHLFPHPAKQMSADGVKPDEINLIIYTHCHPDHMEAGPEIAKSGAKQAMHPDDEIFLRKTGPEFYRMMGLKMPEIKIDVHLVPGDLVIGDHTLQVHHTPGHSPGSICLYWPDRKVLITGDLIFAQGVGRTDFPGGSGRLLKDSIRRMSALDVEVILPGHGPAVVGRQNVLKNFQAIERMYFPMI